PFRSDRFVVVAGRAHPLAARSAVAFSEVLEHDFVGLDRASALQRFLSGRAVRLGASIRLRVQLRSFDGVCRLVEAGVGIGIVPETTARRALRSSDLAIVALEDAWAERDLMICVRALDGLPRSARALVEHLLGARAVEPADILPGTTP
ncbi:MAG: LysR family transcriptional regulator, partial [Enterovirga sp.]|nr:LysR family transcriptional regulator [Enterovirga sp.]